MRKSKEILYHVSCMANDDKEFYYNNARCFNVNVPNIGSSKAVLYDILSLKESVKYIKQNKIKNAVIYILACRIGPFIGQYKKKLDKLGGKIYVNPDGHEWKRSKWNAAIRKYWKYSESLMVKYADLLICDSKGIEKYINKEYKKFNPHTEFISYGANIPINNIRESSDELKQWYTKNNTSENEYYLVVGRFVPENNYELMIREFMQSSSKKDLIIISNVEQNQFYQRLLEETNFEKDSRIKFVGTVYDQKLLEEIRLKAHGYIHGHEVGGTNPSLLEALATTKLNLLLDVVFNREVGSNGALYFNKESGSLAKLIEKVDYFSTTQQDDLSERAKTRISEEYSWEKIVFEYESLFLK